MSNYLAIATVTATLRHVLLDAVRNDVTGSDVTTMRPDDVTNGTPDPRVNLYLFQVTSNAAYRNTDLPSRSANSDVIQRPRIALDLHYLLTVYGNEGTLEPQRLLGSAVRTLHEHPVLTRDDINSVIINPSYPYLTESDLANEIELVKFTPSPMSLEELSKLWSVFFQIPYALSISYMATVVLIESDISPKATLPVLERNIVVLPFRSPHIDNIMAVEGPLQPIQYNSTLLIKGQNLFYEKVLVRVAGEFLDPTSVKDKEIVLNLANTDLASKLRSGVQGLQVIHVIFDRETNDPPPYGFESNVAAFIVQPVVLSKNISYESGRIIIKDIKPVIGRMQRVFLILNEITQDTSAVPRSYVIKVPLNNDASELSIPVVNVANGEYLVRLQIDGAQSPLEKDTTQIDNGNNSSFVGPKVTIGEQKPEQYKLMTLVEPENSGEIKKDPDQDKFDSGESVQLTATAKTGFSFDKWSGEIDTNAPDTNPLSLQMDKDHSVTAHFVEIQSIPVNLIITTEPENAGIVVKNPDKQTFNKGENVQIQAVANEGFNFKNWSGDLDTTSNPQTLTMDSDKTIVAHFIEVAAHEIRVKSIDMSAWQESGHITAKADVLIWDENGTRNIEGAEVTVRWTLPDMSTQEQTNATDNRGGALFNISAGEGNYILDVLDIKKSGYTYNPDAGETQNTMTV